MRNPTRLSEAPHWTPYASGGGLGVIPRRGADPLSLFTSEQLRDLVVTNPMRVVMQLPRLHPSVDMALNTALRLTCGKDSVDIIAHKVNPDGTQGDVDPKDNASLDAMWAAAVPAECGGGLRGLRTMLMKHVILAGMIVLEAVPGPALSGVARLWPLDSLTCGFTRPSRNADIVLRQRQRYPGKPQQGSAFKPAASGPEGWAYGWVEMPPDRVFWGALDQDVDDPHGCAPYASALNEVIADLALMQDLRDAVHNAAWPRYQVGVNLAELHKVAVEVYHIHNPKAAAEWVTARYQEVVDYVAQLNADDNIVHDSSGDVKVLQPGSFDGLEGVLSFLRQRIAQSLKTLPTLLGINDGSTFNYTSVEWQIYAAGLETLADMVDEILVKAANLHLRLIGSKSRASCAREMIRTTDAQVDANTESTRIANETAKTKLGYTSNDQGSMSITGKPAVGKPVPGVIEPLPAPATGSFGKPAARPGTSKAKPGKRNLPRNGNNTGTTQEERGAKKGPGAEWTETSSTGKPLKKERWSWLEARLEEALSLLRR